MYDVVIIGAGPAGVSAGLYTARANLKTMIIYKGESSLNKTNKIDNYYGLEGGIEGKKLYEKGLEQAKKIGIEIENEEVLEIEQIDSSSFITKTVNREFKARNIIIATGISQKKINVKGIEEFEGKGISYCSICDGFFFKNKNVAVIGNKNYAINEIKHLLPIVKQVKMLTNGEMPVQNRDISVDINEKKIREVRGQEKVEEILFDDGSIEKVDGIFIATDTATSTDLARKLGIALKENKIVVNEDMETNIKGIYACGDCVGGLYQISKAVYEGAKAGLSIIKNKEKQI